MRILAVDTATKSCSVAIIDKESLLAELTAVKDQTHSKHLLAMITCVTRTAGLTISDLDAFAVTIGPGSFTGLRIGISTVKGLAVARDKPVVGISSLEALASQSVPCPYLVCPFLDARKGEVYFGRYRFNDHTLEKEGVERVLPPEEAVIDIREPCVFLGNGAQLYREVIQAKLGELAYFTSQINNTIRASTVAILGMQRFKKFGTDDVAGLVPNYIRKSDAELSLAKKLPGSNK